LRPDFRWLALSVAELVLMVAFIVFANAHSWSSTAGTWTATAYLVAAIFVNDRIERWTEQRASRRRNLHH
jgi:hypothetical protein